MKTKRFSLVRLTTIIGMVLVPALAIKSQEGGCDGPVLHNGYMTGACHCHIYTHNGGTVGECTGTITTYNSYYSCGGNTTQTCDSQTQKIGNTWNCVSLDYEEGGCAYDSGCGPDLDNGQPQYASVCTGTDGTCNIAQVESLKVNGASLFAVF